MITPDEMRGGWIAYTNWVIDCRPLIFHPVAFRKDFTVSGRPSRAELLISAADKYALWLNGRLVGYGPARSYPQRKLYDVYDIAPLVRRGANSIAVLVLPCTGANFLTNYTRMGLFVQADVRMPGGKRVYVASDDSWDCRIAEWVGLDYLLVSAPVGAQEHVDATRPVDEWKTAMPGKGWTKALYLGPAGYPPWLKLVPRPIPLLSETAAECSLAWTGNASKAMPDVSRNLAALFNSSRITGRPVETARVAETYENVDHNIWVFDFGRTRLVRPGIEVLNANDAARIELYYDIKLDGRPTAEMGFRSPMEGGCDSFTVGGGRRKWEVLVPRGLRFMTVKVSGPGRVRFRLACRTVDYPFGDGARFSSTDSFFDSAWEISKNNLRSSINDVAVDCCNRENLLWTMDAAATLKAAFYSFGETAMWRRCLDLIGQGVDGEGRPSTIVPTDVPSSIFGQAMHWVLSILEYYTATGDSSLLSEQAAAVRRYLSMCESHVTGEGFFISPAWSWHCVDWAPIDQRAYSLPVNALLVMACDSAAEIAHVIGDNELGRMARRIGNRVRKALAAFWDPRAQAFRSRIVPRTKLAMPALKPNSLTSDLAKSITHNVHANVLAARALVGTGAMRRLALIHAAKCFSLPRGPINEIGVGYADILLSPLAAAGHTDVVLAKLRAMYQPFINIGAPTWGENAWPPKVCNTAHGWAASVSSAIVEGLIGLRPAAPGWAAVSFAPAAGFETACQYSLETPAGLVEAECGTNGRAIRAPKGVKVLSRGRALRSAGKWMRIE